MWPADENRLGVTIDHRRVDTISNTGQPRTIDARLPFKQGECYMSEELLGQLLFYFVLMAGLVQITLLTYFVLKKNWPEVRSVLVVGIAWFGATIGIVLFSIGLCAAGCPGPPFETIIGIIGVTPSALALGWRWVRYKARIEKRPNE